MDVLWLAKGQRMTRRDPASLTLTRKRRCAVYTRKSTDEGLEKEFNSLDAQRECLYRQPAFRRLGAGA